MLYACEQIFRVDKTKVLYDNKESFIRITYAIKRITYAITKTFIKITYIIIKTFFEKEVKQFFN